MAKKIINQDTFNVIERATLSLSRKSFQPEWTWFESHNIRTASELSFIRHRLMSINELIKHDKLNRIQEEFQEKSHSINWLFYEEEEEIIPIYDEAIGVSVKRLIINPSEIPYLLKFIGISGTNSGLDIENHDGKGYHFHYGKIKRDALERYDVLMTFDKRTSKFDKQPIEHLPLYVEPHAAGKCVHIDAATIGHNRRLPIYLVCEKAMKSRGLENFLSPSNDSSIFYPMS